MSKDILGSHWLLVYSSTERGKLQASFNKNRVEVLKSKKINESHGESCSSDPSLCWNFQLKSILFVSKPDDALNLYYAQEKETLLKQSMDTLRLIKHILDDPQNEKVKGDLIGFLHAMRQGLKGQEIKNRPYTRKTKDQTWVLLLYHCHPFITK
jgi:hypothetical protein